MKRACFIGLILLLTFVTMSYGQEVLKKPVIPKKTETTQQTKTTSPVTSPSRTTSPIEMIYVAGGTFTMGCTGEQGSDCYGDEKPAHQVTLSAYYIGKYKGVKTKRTKQTTINNAVNV